MKVLSVATVTARGEPRISALDGHFLHGTWTFCTSGTAAKARHMRGPADGQRRPRRRRGDGGVQPRPGRARCAEADADWDETIEHWTAHYGSSPLDWGERSGSTATGRTGWSATPGSGTRPCKRGISP